MCSFMATVAAAIMNRELKMGKQSNIEALDAELEQRMRAMHPTAEEDLGQQYTGMLDDCSRISREILKWRQAMARGQVRLDHQHTPDGNQASSNSPKS